MTKSSGSIPRPRTAVKMQGEAYLRGHGSPDVVAYRNTRTHWEDGAELTEADRRAIVDELLASTRERGWTIEVE